MVHSAVTISLVDEARGGPFVLWDDLAESCALASDLGYDGVELFLPSPDAVDEAELRSLLEQHNLRVAAVGTGAGWVIHKLSLTASDSEQREAAQQLIRRMIEFGAKFKAPAIIGSMQGRSGDGTDHETAMQYLRDALNILGPHAAEHGTPLIYEPLNRYETNLCNTISQGVALCESLKTDNIALLADMFHMNIEEADMPAAILAGGQHIGHVHFADSNRRPIGCGHTDVGPVVQALRAINYEGWISAEVFPWPTPKDAAAKNMNSYRKWLS